MASFNGRWKVTTTTNVKEFFKALGFSDAVIEAGKDMDDVANDLIDEIALTDSELKVTEFMKGKPVNKYVYPLGKEVEQSEGGQTFKVKAVVDGGCIKVTQTGADYEAVYTRKVDGSNMTIDMDSNKGVKATRTLTKA